jgi:D-alanyl-D-alanine carboxypeptidase/D-alanyl-D-alanine-endopeptidase (penicillin-binding protein 4)
LGIKVNGRPVEKPIDPNCSFRMLAEYSTSLADCLERANKNSLGLAAESMLKTIAANAGTDKKNGSWAEGRQIISQYLLSLSVDKGEFNIDDGSGLSRENRLSANAITRVLLDVYRGKNWQLYKDCLAEGGVEGTIGRYFKEEEYKGKIFGKTGYIEKVKSFSGVCNTKKGDYIFSILANNANDHSREAINDIAKAVIDEAEKQEQAK